MEGVAGYTPATGEAGEVLVDGVDAAQLDGGLVVVLPDLYQAVSVVVATARVFAGCSGRTPMYEIPMVAVLLMVFLGDVGSWGWRGLIWESHNK